MKTKQRQNDVKKKKRVNPSFFIVCASQVIRFCFRNFFSVYSVRLIERRSNRKCVDEQRDEMRERNGDKNNVHLYVIELHAISLSITMVWTGIVAFSVQFLMPQSICVRVLSIMSCEFVVRFIFAYRTANTDCPFKKKKKVAGVN